MSDARHVALSFNADALIDGLRPYANDDEEIEQIVNAIQPTYEHVIQGNNMAEITELNRILKEMNGILAQLDVGSKPAKLTRKVKKIHKEFNEMRERARHDVSENGIRRLAIIDMILYHSVWLSEQAALECARNIEDRRRKQYDADYAAESAEMAYRDPRQAARDADAAAKKTLEDAAAKEAAERQAWVQMMGSDPNANGLAGQMMALRAYAVASQGKPAKRKPSTSDFPAFTFTKRKGGKKSHKKGGKKSHKKRSHRRRRH